MKMDSIALERADVSRRSHRYGLTMLEVIFAMVVILVGLVGVGLLIPLAGRQAADSYQITHGLATGESVVQFGSESRVFTPSSDMPWCYIEDSGGMELRIETLRDLYRAIAISNFGVSSGTAEQAAINQNSVVSEGFCLDPLFWGAQVRGANPYSANAEVVRTNFPHFSSLWEPVSTATGPAVPRFRRLSFRDPTFGIGVQATRGTWLRQPVARDIARLFGGDVVQATTTTNKAVAPIRASYMTGGSLTESPASGDSPTWMVCVQPAENTPVIRTSDVKQLGLNQYSNIPEILPKYFNATIVISARRNVNELTPGLTSYPENERVLSVTAISAEAFTSGAFDVTLEGGTTNVSRIRSGDWIMLSRASARNLVPISGGIFFSPVHRWYRVVAVDRNEPFPVTVRLVGKPWGQTEFEARDGIVVPADRRVQATVLKDVIQVFERQVELF